MVPYVKTWFLRKHCRFGLVFWYIYSIKKKAVSKSVSFTSYALASELLYMSTRSFVVPLAEDKEKEEFSCFFRKPRYFTMSLLAEVKDETSWASTFSSSLLICLCSMFWYAKDYKIRDVAECTILRLSDANGFAREKPLSSYFLL